ncbi:MAG: hypothetical protein IJ397_08535 [Lachnospiraceae bacterium]|nr:hypothetical protein [Lachnospiraceae bacterium]
MQAENLNKTMQTGSEQQTKSSKMNVPKYLVEITAFGVFLILSVVMFVYHEPWYDEIQAWMVASDASFGEMIFTLPHYEGHPPIWTLLLSIFAKTGVPMEIGLRIPTLLFSAIAAFLVIFKAPFKKWIRCLIPFSYYLFYQYTVICRPYSMMFLGFVLAAMFYKERNKKPARYLAALFLLCVSSAYGILFAGVLCVIWTVEIIKELKGKDFIQKAVKDSRTWLLFTMLMLAVGILTLIWPADNAFAQVRVVDFSKIRCLIYTFLVLPADALLSDIALTGRLQQYDYIVQADYATILCIMISLALYVVMITAAHIFRKKAILILPYVAFAGYAALGYFYNHHIGIIPLFVLFVFWCAIDDQPKEIVLPKFLQKLDQSVSDFWKKTGYFFTVLVLGVSIFWTVTAVKNDIQLPVWYAKGLAAMLEEYELTDCRIINQWTYAEKGTVEEVVLMESENISEEEDGYMVSTEIPQLKAEDYYQYTKMCNFVDILAYSDTKENYIYNFNGGDANNRYVNHDMLSEEESLVYLRELGEQGYPEVIIGNPEVLGMMGLDVYEYRYVPVYAFVCYRINKYNAIYAREFVYVREDIFLTREDWPIYEQISNGFAE